jgi:hypothetical protein
LGCFLSRLGEPIGAGSTSAGDVGDAELVAQIAALERVKAGCAARQARLTVLFDSSQRAKQRTLGVRAEKVGRGVAEQVALARRESPSRGARHLREAKALVLQMPHTLRSLAAGEVTEWAASLAVAETSCLSEEDRGRVDAELADRLPTLSPAQVRGQAAAAACRLDPAAVVKRNAKAVNERRVSVRPAPDCMTYLTALLPVKDGVACFAALVNAAKAAHATGDPRGKGQVMADTLVDRLTHPATTTSSTNPTVPSSTIRPLTSQGPDDATGRVTGDATSDATGDPGDGDDVAAADAAQGDTIEICLVMTDTALLAGGDDPVLVTSTDVSGSNPAAGMVPAPVARDMVRDAARVFVRRLYTDPGTGQLVAMESSRRVFAGKLRRMLLLRDQTCRTPWCGAPIRHGDHVVDHADGGPTSLPNAQGLCERCNQTKNLLGWSAEVLDATPGGHTVRTITPTGHTYDSVAPPLLGSSPGGSPVAHDTAIPRSTDPPRRPNNDQRTPEAADDWTFDDSALERALEQLIRDHRPVLCDSGVGHVPR